jgi:hypothetical protein
MKSDPNDTTGLTNEEWEEVHSRCGHDLMQLLMDFKHDRVTAEGTGNRILRRCAVVADIALRKERDHQKK